MENLSEHEETLMVAALERAERVERARIQREEFLKRWANRQSTDKSVEHPSTSNDSPVTQPPPPIDPIVVIRPAPIHRSPHGLAKITPLTSPTENPNTPQNRLTAIENKQFECKNRCGKYFSTRRKMMRHVKAVHVPHALTCERCKTKFKTRSNLNRHHRQRRGFCNAKKEETLQTATTDTPRKSNDADEGRRILRYDGEEEEENAQEHSQDL
ncbi:uncharacterized protein [Apostichopus japonicus]|uniref:uncharacterized protein isoform X2 n=1 Tax=Stichopus japonicus TaxID=307972 RepID=UPI003AB1FC44